MSELTADFSRFREKMRAAALASKKDDAYIVNRTCRNVAFRAASFTPKTTAAKIRADLRRGKLLVKLAASQLKKQKGKFTRKDLADRMRRIQKSRTGNVTALRAGWAKAIIEMGGNFRGAKLRAAGSAAEGFGRRATLAHLFAHIRNAIVTRDHSGRETGAANIPVLRIALSQAIEFVTADMEVYAMRKKDQTLRQHSDR